MIVSVSKQNWVHVFVDVIHVELYNCRTPLPLWGSGPPQRAPNMNLRCHQIIRYKEKKYVTENSFFFLAIP